MAASEQNVPEREKLRACRSEEGRHASVEVTQAGGVSPFPRAISGEEEAVKSKDRRKGAKPLSACPLREFS